MSDTGKHYFNQAHVWWCVHRITFLEVKQAGYCSFCWILGKISSATSKRDVEGETAAPVIVMWQENPRLSGKI